MLQHSNQLHDQLQNMLNFTFPQHLLNTYNKNTLLLKNLQTSTSTLHITDGKTQQSTARSKPNTNWAEPNERIIYIRENKKNSRNQSNAHRRLQASRQKTSPVEQLQQQQHSGWSISQRKTVRRVERAASRIHGISGGPSCGRTIGGDSTRGRSSRDLLGKAGRLRGGQRFIQLLRR